MNHIFVLVHLTIMFDLQMNSFYTCMYSTTELSQRHEIVKNNVIDKWSEGIASLQKCALQCLSLC